MTRKQSNFELQPPEGMDVSTGYEHLPKNASPLLKNVRLFDPKTGKLRLSKRRGLSKWWNIQSLGTPIQDLNQYVTASYSDAGGTQVRRSTDAFLVTDGDIYHVTTTSANGSNNGTNALSATPHQIFSAQAFGYVYYVDGTNDVRLDPDGAADGNVDDWSSAVTDGSMPSGTRLIEMWRGRTVLAGNESAPHNWYMSRQADPLDWDYAQTDAQAAVAGNNSKAGEIGDVINAVIPYSDDYIIFGCDHSIWMMSGCPMCGGRIDNISEVTGMVWGRPWCTTPDKRVLFYGSRGGVWSMTPGQSLPERISRTVDSELNNYNVQENIFRMAYDTQFDLVHLFITPIGGTTAGTHYVYDVNRDGWTKDEFASYNHDGYCCKMFDGDAPDDRVLLIGSKDGHVRKYDTSVSADDGLPFQSEAWYGAVMFRDDNLVVLKTLRPTMSNNTDQATLEVYGHLEAYEAVTGDYSYRTTVEPGRNYARKQRSTGKRIFVVIKDENANGHWSVESIWAEADSIYSKRKRWLV